MNQCVSRCSPFDLSKTDQIAAFEVAISMLEFPQRRFRRASMEHVADYIVISKRAPTHVLGLYKPL